MVSGAAQSFANEGGRDRKREERLEGTEGGRARRKAESGRKDGESMNGSLGILQRQRDVSL